MWYHNIMNDDNKIVNQNVTPVAQTDQSQTQPVVPVGSPNKETGPVGESISEFVKPSETEPQISQELKDIGIEEEKDAPDLTFEHKKAGIDHAGPYTPFPNQSSGKVKLPMSEAEIENQLKTGQDDDSGKWLAGLIQKIIKAMGF